MTKVLLFSWSVVVLFTFTHCGSGKYYADFKHEKKQIDTLVVLTPYVSVEFLKNQEFSKDYELEDSLTAKIYTEIMYNLNEKYQLIDCMLQPDSINAIELAELFLHLDNSTDSVLTTPPFIQNLIKNNPNRYFLMVCFNGYYNAHFEPYYFQKQALFANTMYINVGKVYSSDIRLFVFDNQKNIVVFYDRKYSQNTDPRITDFVKKMTSDILMPIYYK